MTIKILNLYAGIGGKLEHYQNNAEKYPQKQVEKELDDLPEDRGITNSKYAVDLDRIERELKKLKGE